MSDDPWLVIGLGNPGASYAGNRHNVGQMVLDHLAGEVGGRFGKHKVQATVLEGRLPARVGRPGPRLVLAKPTTYMNESGGPVAGLMRFYGVTPEHLIVVHDELDLPFGTTRLKSGGGEGGHNGLRSITRSLGSGEYRRLRLGIGRPPGRMDPADFVLRDFSASERTDAELLVVDGADAITAVLIDGFERAQGVVNARVVS